MNKIAEAAYQTVIRGFTPYDAGKGYCLRVTRQIVSEGLGINYEEFKRRYWTHTVEDNKTGVPWARDMQRSLREARQMEITAVAIKDLQAGDLVFAWDLAQQGHVGVMYDTRLIIENTGSKRGIQISGYNHLSPLSTWPTESLEAFRLV